MLYLHLFCGSVSKMCPKVIVSSLYTTSDKQRFHRNTLCLDSGGNLYIASIWLLMIDIILEILQERRSRCDEAAGREEPVYCGRIVRSKELSQIGYLILSLQYFPQEVFISLQCMEMLGLYLNLTCHVPTPATDLVINSSSLNDTL